MSDLNLIFTLQSVVRIPAKSVHTMNQCDNDLHCANKSEDSRCSVWRALSCARQPFSSDSKCPLPVVGPAVLVPGSCHSNPTRPACQSVTASAASHTCTPACRVQGFALNEGPFQGSGTGHSQSVSAVTHLESKLPHLSPCGNNL